METTIRPADNTPKEKKIILELIEWKIITDFLSGITIPLFQSDTGYNVFKAVQNAREIEITEEK